MDIVCPVPLLTQGGRPLGRGTVPGQSRMSRCPGSSDQPPRVPNAIRTFARIISHISIQPRTGSTVADSSNARGALSPHPQEEPA
jgi:hypothetical protein